MNDSLSTFKFSIIKYTIAIAVVIEVCSIPVLGFRAEFLCGLLAGALISVLSFIMMVYMSKRTLESGIRWMTSLGYLIRLPIYGAVFLICIKTGGLIAGIACLAGFLTNMAAIIFIHGIKPNFSKGKKGRVS